MIKNTVVGAAIAGCLSLFTLPGFAQSQTNYELSHQIAETERQAIVAASLPLTDQEAVDFWPLYQDYRKAIKEIDDTRAQLLQSFAENYTDLSNDEANAITEKALSIDVERQKIKKKYLKQFHKILPGARMLRFYQIETKLEAMRRYGWTSQIPLAIPSQE